MSGLAAKRAERRRDAHRAAVTGRRRRVYDGQHSQRLAGRLVMSDSGRSSSDVEVQEAWSGARKTYDFFRAIVDRDSIDGHGLTLDATVHYGKHFDNAFLNGRQMVYGDGDERVFKRSHRRARRHRARRHRARADAVRGHARLHRRERQSHPSIGEG
jgi:Zn-dependent metalloprotease